MCKSILKGLMYDDLQLMSVKFPFFVESKGVCVYVCVCGSLTPLLPVPPRNSDQYHLLPQKV